MSTWELTVSDVCLKSSPAEDVEAQLVTRLRDGEISAVGEAYDRHHEAVRAFCRRLTSDAQAAEDLVQEVFVTLPSVMRRFRGDSSLRTFLLSIAVNHSRHFIRGLVRRRRAMHRLSEVVELDCGAGADDNPEHLTRRKQLAMLLRRGLEALPLDQRVAFVLCEVEERSSSDVAVIVGAKEATVRTRVFYAKKKLQQFFAEQGGLS